MYILHTYTYLLQVRRANSFNARCVRGGGVTGGVTVGLLQDILLLVFVCARINHLFITPAHLHYPHYCNTYARLLCNIRPLPDTPC